MEAPYNNEKGKLSSVNSTCTNLGLMIELGLSESNICRKTIEHLLSIQGEDGCWDENHAISQYNPPFWNMPGDLKTKTWLTTSILNYLIQLSYRKSKAVKKATQFLLKNRDEKGNFVGFLHSTWLSIGVFGQLEGANSEVVKKALKVIEQNIKRMKDVTSNLTWCLECFYIAGISKNDPTVKKYIEIVTELQRPNGGWAPTGGEKSDVPTTINALRALKLYKIW